ncbi:hypothetical protein FoTM2_003057 [Fusarium oxysporum f. sp. vasinfectum]|nr:hypothetical protein FoTM2_003057 [Fusarium oxysporum f. sp. vasinfectum]
MPPNTLTTGTSTSGVFMPTPRRPRIVSPTLKTSSGLLKTRTETKNWPCDKPSPNATSHELNSNTSNSRLRRL